MLVASFSLFLLVFVVIGILSVFYSRQTSRDYLLAGQDVKPWLVSFSAVASNCSGYMFIGLIGYTYFAGLSAMWLQIGWVLGDFWASFIIHKRLRSVSSQKEVLSFTDVLSRWHGEDYRTLRVAGGLITLAFLGTYAAAQLSAGSKALHVLFDWDFSVGAIIGAMIVLLYCVAGGIRASIWTDVAQSFVMIVSMGLLCVVALISVGGIDAYIAALHQVSPTYMDVFPSDLFLGGMTGPFLFVLGWLMAGFGVAGQPHIMVRFMTISNVQSFGHVRFYYYSWYAVFSALVIATGLATRILLPEIEAFDAELALPVMAQQLLPEVLVGLILAGLFAATMSTADSQILCCSAAITSDFNLGQAYSYRIAKVATVFVTLIALSIALLGSQNVFQLVQSAWSVLGASFAPLLVVYALGGRPSERVALAMMVLGALTALLWGHSSLNNIIYGIAPGLAAGFLPYVLTRSKQRL